MAKEWNDDEVKELIGESVRIVREDKFEAFVRGKLAPANNDPNDPKNGPTNPPGDPKPGDPPPSQKRKSLFWGEVDD